MIEPLDISGLEETWEDYKNGNLNDMGKLNLVAWMGERMGLVLREIWILRVQAEGLQSALEEERQTTCLVAKGGAK